ncbi:MAG: DNA polymerase III subunit gamma/tau [Alphaproteobacteria bacterium]|nr:DNA polymerase III subunit gamma/tau [Alphaproteobacteria bacterium]
MEQPNRDLNQAGSGLGAATSTDAPQAAPYRVLARKYRPARFEDLIGQEAMVRTLSNAFDLGRIHQAYILTGVRGVGKTTTARILARAFNYELPACGERPAVDYPTIHMPELGAHCQAIIESRHVDVIEMDAASHTGIDDVREIIESARYKPVMARSKVYIIDEVHMLSKQAFNGLLKTLEEPPDHVKFLFATTEIDKVPVTVRSRCQRFDLRRVEAGMLIGHLAAICAQEGVTIEPEALRLIARAAEGSVRDALSLLDQAIAQGSGATPSGVTVTAEALRELLGLADHGRIIDLFEALMGGGMASALNLLKELHDCGADPAEVLASLADFIHLVTRLKLVPEAGQDNVLTPDERQRGSQFAASLSMPVLTRAWQLLLKGLREVKESPRPLAAADMVLVRIGYAADLPTPDEALRKLAARTGGEVPERSVPGKNPPGSGSVIRASSAAALAAAPRESIPAAPSVRLSRFEDVVALAGEHRDIQMKLALERDVRLVRFEPGQIEFSLKAGASPQLAQTLARRLLDWTGNRWMVVVSSTEGYPSLKEQEEARVRETFSGVSGEPLVQSVLAAFPGAEIIAVRPLEPAPEAAHGNDEVGFHDDLTMEDEL